MLVHIIIAVTLIGFLFMIAFQIGYLNYIPEETVAVGSSVL